MNRRHLASFLAASALALLTTGLQAADTRVVKHARGDLKVPAVPQKVVVFDTASLDTLDALGVSNIVAVPQTSAPLPPFLAKYQGKPYANAGTLFEPAFEAVAAIGPDLIVGGGRATAAYAELAKIAPTLELVVDDTRFLDNFQAQVRTLATVFGKQAEGERQLAALQQRIAQVRGTAAGAGTAMVVLVSGGRVSAYGPGSRFGFVHDVLGLKPALPLKSEGRHGTAMSFELLLKADPDWLFVIDRDSAIGAPNAAAAKAVLDNELVNKTQAKRLGRVVYLDSASIYLGGGLQTWRQLTDQVGQALSAAGTQGASK